jgi:hypothetical protein
MINDVLVAEHLFTQRRADVLQWFDDFGYVGSETDNEGHYWGEFHGSDV